MGTVVGIGFLPSIVVAMVDLTPAALAFLTGLRRSIYLDLQRRGLDVPPKRAFQGHITLGYMEISDDWPPAHHDAAASVVTTAEQVRRQAEEAVAAARATFTPVEFPISGGLVFSFADLSAFTPPTINSD